MAFVLGHRYEILAWLLGMVDASDAHLRHRLRRARPGAVRRGRLRRLGWRVGGRPARPRQRARQRHRRPPRASGGIEYRDSRGFDTLGYGTRLPITKAEGELLLRAPAGNRHDALRCRPVAAVESRLPGRPGTPSATRAYNLGCEGLLEFGNALSRPCAARLCRGSGAREEFRRSPERVVRQDPRRVEAVIARLPK